LLRQIFSGEKTNFDGEFVHSHNYRNSAAPINLPIYVAALRANMLEMAAGLADGVILNLFPCDALPKIMEHIRIGAEKAGRDPASIEVVCRYQVAVTDDPARARAQMRKGFVPYFATSVYNQFLRWAGHKKAAEAILAGWQSGDRARTAAAFSDDLIDAIAIIGSADECRQRIHEYAKLGIHTHIITPLGETPQEFEATLTAFAKEKFSFP
jgi:alkanesulfonate monooxygenase SsuD/methylene tetrahydromethanopterin reductase-like flavin-dependent oxidoreductase (luciferase family)